MISDRTAKQVIARLQQGKEPGKIMEETGVSYYIIRRLRKEANLPPWSRTRRGPSAWFLKRQTEALKLWDMGLTLPEIAREMEVSKQRVHQYMKGQNTTKMRCARCKLPSRRLHYFHENCGYAGGTEGLCPRCVQEITGVVTTEHK